MHVRVSARQSHCVTEVQIIVHCQIASWHHETDSRTFDPQKSCRNMSTKSYLGRITGAKRGRTNNIAQLQSVYLHCPVKEEDNKVGTVLVSLRTER